MPYAATTLKPEEQSHVPVPGYVPLLWDELALAADLPLDKRPRMYGYLESERQIVAIRSAHDVERHDGRVSFAWTSGTTIADLIERAR